MIGTEFSKSNDHTANGISIRFPRVTRIRSDKSARDATSLKRLEHLSCISRDFSFTKDLVDSNEKESEKAEVFRVSTSNRKKESVSKKQEKTKDPEIVFLASDSEEDIIDADNPRGWLYLFLLFLLFVCFLHL